MAAAAAAATILELDPSHERAGRIIEDIVRLERRIFPKHESLARSFHDELKRRNSGLIYSTSSASADADEVSGYAMYTFNTSLCASITKLAGAKTRGARSIALVRSVLQFSAKTVTKCSNSGLVVAVKEGYRRQGYGEALLAAAVERCRRRRVQRLSLHVDPERTAAVALYRKAGFQVDATVQDYYAPQRNAYRMYIDLY